MSFMNLFIIKWAYGLIQSHSSQVGGHSLGEQCHGPRAIGEFDIKEVIHNLEYTHFTFTMYPVNFWNIRMAKPTTGLLA